MQMAMACKWEYSNEEHEQLSSLWGQVHSRHCCCPHTLMLAEVPSRDPAPHHGAAQLCVQGERETVLKNGA